MIRPTSQLTDCGGKRYVGSVAQYYLDGLLPCLHPVASKYMEQECSKHGVLGRNAVAKDVMLALRCMSGCFLLSDWQTALHCLWFKYDLADFGPELEERVRAENLASLSELARVNCPGIVVRHLLTKSTV